MLSLVEVSANWTGTARYGWTLSSGPNTFSPWRTFFGYPGVRGEGETHDRAPGRTGVTGLSDAERDACDAMQALIGLAALLRRPVEDQSGSDPGDPVADDARRLLLSIAEDGGAAAARVVDYLREQRGAGDGELVAVPPRLGQWRQWMPPRGHLFGVSTDVRKAANEVPRPRRDPGE
jgi:hypothetical protein